MKDCWEVADALLPHSKRMLLYGVPGTGKTHQATKTGLHSYEQVLSVTLTRDAMAAELRGVYLPSGSNGEWLFHDGACVVAMRLSQSEPVRLVLNELDRASEDALSFLLSVLDDSEVAAETLPTGETISSGPGLQVIGTINGEPEALPDALRDRLAVQVRIDKPHPQAIEALPEDLRDAARGTIGHEDVARRLSVRAWFAFAQLRSEVEPELAAQAVFGSRAQTVLDSLGIARLVPKGASSGTQQAIQQAQERSRGGERSRAVAAQQQAAARQQAATAPAPAQSYTCPSCEKSVKKVYHYARSAEPVCGPCWAHYKKHGELPQAGAVAAMAAPGATYPCDFCGASNESPIAKARHSRYCKDNPKNDPNAGAAA